MFSSMSRLIIGVFLCSGVAAAQFQLKEGTGSIGGRVTIGGKPAQGLILTIRESDADERRALNMLFHGKPSAKATTDTEGNYRFSGLADGDYEVSAFAPSLFSSDDKSTSVTVTDGAKVDDIDFSLSRGGVITGRVTTSNGRPVIMEPVQVSSLDQPNANSSFRFLPSFPFTTDDRGVYRVYGLMPGRYRVSVGNSMSVYDQMAQGLKRPARPRTFHPGVTDQAAAAIVDLAAGGEASNIDIKLGEANKTYKATGRVVEVETNKPIPNAVPSYQATRSDSPESGMPKMGAPTSSTGDFRFEGLGPGEYIAYCYFGIDGASDFYSDMVTFEVKQADLSGLEIKAHRGVSMSGVAVVEGTTDPSVIERLGQAELFVTVVSEGGAAPNFARSKISDDGGFQLRGLRPGRARLILQDLTGLRIRRVERSGVPQPEGLEVVAGDNLTDIRVVIVYAGGAIRGQVNVDAGELPKGARLSVGARRVNSSSDHGEGDHDFGSGNVDSAGRFKIDGLIAGEYEVTVTAILNPEAAAASRKIRQARQRVVVTGESPAEMILVLELGKTTERD